jgi:hypothetical protein
MEIIIFKLSDNGCGNNTIEPNAPTDNTMMSEPSTKTAQDPKLPTEQTMKIEPYTKSLP